MKKAILVAVATLFLAANAYSADDKSFAKFLEKYQAWDVLEQTLATETESPEIVLKQALAFMRMNAPLRALSMLKAQPPFEDQNLETQRLWMGGQAARQAGDPVQAVLWFSQAARGMDDKTIAEKFQSEPRLSVIWKDVWRKLYITYETEPGSARHSGRATLGLALSQAMTAWPDSPFWDRVFSLWTDAPLDPVMDGDQPLTVAPAFVVTTTDKEAIAVAMARAGLSRFDRAQESIDSITNPVLKEFWSGIITALSEQNPFAQAASFQDQGLAKAYMFLKTYVSLPDSFDRNAWLARTDKSESWQNFTKNLEAMGDEKALGVVDNEVRSTLIDPATASSLQTLRLGISLAAQDKEKARDALSSMNTASIPLCVKLAAVISLDIPARSLFQTAVPAGQGQMEMFGCLTQAAGTTPDSKGAAPFWGKFDAAAIDNGSLIYPLDPMVILANWEQAWQKKKDIHLAKRIAFLFPESSAGTKCLAYLSSEYLDQKSYNLASYFLRKMNPARIAPEDMPAYLEAKADLAFNIGKSDEALAAYKELIDEYKVSLAPVKELQAALMAQQKGELEWADTVLRSLYARDDVDNKLKAEIMFWIAEGDQSRHKTEQALKEYLTLAWKYPEQNIWAVTAMYRASLIYEKKGKYEAAKKLLATVIKNADRDAQKEAAQARLRAVEKKMGKKAKGAAKVEYPF